MERNPENIRLHPEKLRLSGDGIFYTIQGEGKTMGEPACFLRLHLCNLHCSWCDTPYTWNPELPEFWNESYELTIAETAELVKSTWGADEDTQKRLVITGGEPLIQQENIIKLINELGTDWKIEIETNGVITPKEELFGCQFNCSPKLANSGNPVGRIRPETLKILNVLDSQFKFVVQSPEDIYEIEKDYLPHISKNKIVIMPEGTDVETLREHAYSVTELIKSRGYRMMNRLQVEIWGKKRKV